MVTPMPKTCWKMGLVQEQVGNCVSIVNFVSIYNPVSCSICSIYKESQNYVACFILNTLCVDFRAIVFTLNFAASS